MTNRVWVTGIGAVTPGGWSAGQTWTSVREGGRFGTVLERFPLFEAGTRVGAPVPARADQDLRTSQAVVYGAAAVSEALGSAGLPTDGSQASVDVAVVATHGERTLPGPEQDPLVGPTDMIVDSVREASGASRVTGLYGACAGGGLAIGSGMKLIESGRADVVLAGGTDCLLREIDFFSFCSLYAMTNRECPPEEASCPFDARRDGFLLSEGAGFVVLESERHARARGAEPMACVEGFGFSQNAYHMVASPPDAKGPEYAMRRAMEDARIDPADVGYISAHGTSTRDNDWCETLAVRQSFGAAAETVPISSVKGSLGHSMASAGAVETVLCVTALREQAVPPTMNLKEPDPRCDLDYVPNVARELRFDRVLNNSFGFGGHNATLILGRV